MRLSGKKISVLLLCIIMIFGAASPAKASSLPELGPGNVTEAAEQTQTEDGSLEPQTQALTETEAEPVSEEPAAEEPEADEEPSLPEGLSVEAYLAVKQSVMNNAVVDVYADNTGTPSGTEDIEAGVLLAKRLKKLAQTSEFNAVIFRGSGYIRVRTEANVSSDIAGKLYYNAVATLLGTEYTENGLWYHIQSGKVTGYVKSEYMVSGAEAMDLLTEVVTTWATTVNDAQRLYAHCRRFRDACGFSRRPDPAAFRKEPPQFCFVHRARLVFRLRHRRISLGPSCWDHAELSAVCAAVPAGERPGYLPCRGADADFAVQSLRLRQRQPAALLRRDGRDPLPGGRLSLNRHCHSRQDRFPPVPDHAG